MKKKAATSSEKNQEFRLEIRRKNIQQQFKLLRHETKVMDVPDAEKLCFHHFKQIRKMMLDSNTAFSNQEFRVLIKQLRDVNCSQIVPALFSNSNNLSILLQLQQCNSLDEYSLIFIHEMLLNISASESSDASFHINDLSLRYLQTHKAHIIELLLQIVGNFLVRDQTSKTVYFLIAKASIYRKLLELLLNKKDIYLRIESNFLWFTNKLLFLTHFYHFEDLCRPLYQDLTTFIFYELENSITGGHRKDSSLSTNEKFIYLRTILKASLVPISQSFVDCIASMFDETNNFYLELLCCLTCRTCFALSKEQLSTCLAKLLTAPSDPFAGTILRVISNSLINDATYWPKVLEYFLKYSEKSVIEETSNWSRFGLLAYFVYFMSNPLTEYDIVEIMGVIICGQGAIGIFQGCLEEIANSEHGYKKLVDFGYTFD